MIGFLFYPKVAVVNKRRPISSYEREAVVQKVVQQGKVWRVDFEGSNWYARCERDVVLVPGDTVYVVKRHNITLIIEPLEIADRVPGKF